MPHKRRGHGHHKHPKEADEQKEAAAAKLDDHRSSTSSNRYPTAGLYYGKSQPSQATPKPAAQVSTVKPAQFEKASSGSAMATKSGVVTTATGGATRSGVTAGGSASVGTAGKAKPETNTTPAGATVIDMSSTGSAVVDMTSAGARGGPKEMSKTTAAVSQVKAAGAAPSAGVAATTAVTKPKESPKGAAKSTTATTTVKADVHKVDPAKTSKLVTTTTTGNVSVQGKTEAKTTQAKVQVEVPPAAAKGTKEVDPFDALASILPSVDPVAPAQPVYTGPEVKELDVTFEKGQKCGENDNTLPPGYRFEDMPPAPADAKPKDVPKPLSTDEALDSLSFGFMSSTPAEAKKQEKTDCVVSASSAGSANFAPAPAKKAPPPVAVCPAPPADKKAKMEKASAGSSVKAGQDATKPKTDGGDPMSLDALSALVDTLPKDQPKPDLPKLRPEDIVSEDKHKKEKGVLVGERDDTIPPEYRFNEEELKKLPAPKPEPTIGTGDALDFLSEGFTSSSAAPAKKTPAVPHACPPADKKAKMEKASDDFSLEAGLTSSTATSVKSSACSAPPAGKKAAAGKDATDSKLKTGQSDPLDALSALSETLPVDKPKPELPKLRPEDIVSEDKHKKEKGVLVGERDDTIPPEYRFNEEELKKLPPPKPEPTIGTGDALEFLSEGFMSSSTAPAVQAPAKGVCPPADKKAKMEKVPDDFSLEAGVTSSTATSVKSSACSAPPAGKKGAAGKDATDSKLKTGQGDPLDALSALSETLPVDKPKPELPKLRPEDIVSEDKHKKEKGVLVGERDDTIPPEYRFNEEELKKLPAPKPEPTIGTGEALDFLSEGFTSSSAAPAAVSCCIPPAQTKVEDLSALDQLSSDFVAPAKSAPPPTKKTPQPSSADASAGKTQQAKTKTDKGDPMSLDALSALCDTLPEDVPKPELPELRPEDIVSEDKHDKEKGVLVGERDDTIPPEYRFNEEELKKLPAPKPEPTMGTDDALDLLSEGFMSSAPVFQTPVITPSAPPAQPSADFALDALAGDFVSCSAAPAVKSSACPSTEKAPELSGGADSALEALDALSDTLKDITPAPQPAPLPTKDLVKEKEAVEERLIKMGERDDTLPPEYRPTEEDLKKMEEDKAKKAAEPKKKTMDDKTALDLLSSDFSDTAAAPTAPAASCAATTKLEPPVLDSEPLKPMSGPVLDNLSSTLLPDAPAFKSKTDKPKGKSKSKSKSKKHHAEEPPASDQLPAQPSSDVVPKSTKKGGKS